MLVKEGAKVSIGTLFALKKMILELFSFLLFLERLVKLLGEIEEKF